MQIKRMAGVSLAVLGLGAGNALAETVELTFANALSLPQVAPYQEAVDEFNEAHPNIDVTMINAPWSEYWQQRQVETASGNLPDIWLFVPGFGAEWLYGDRLLPLDAYVESDPDINLPDANQTMLQYMTLNEQLYGIGYDFNGQVIYYNPDLFDRAGLPYPDEGWTTDEFVQTARTISETLSTDGRKIWGFAASNFDWASDGWYRGYGATLIDDEGTYGANNDGGITAISLFSDMIRDGVMPIPDQKDASGQAQSLFLSGTAAMALGVGHTTFIFEDAGVDFGIARLPVGPEGQVGSGLGGAYVISADTEHPDEAYEFLAYITSGPVLAEVVTTGVPARESAWGQLSDRMTEFATKVQGFESFNAVKGSFQVMDIQRRVLAEVWNGSLDVPEAMAQIEEEANAALADASAN
ncbi:MAG: sugar ABC transporter substrate-binding protein [Hyphomonas sp.]|nr:sugar ABC transporter substrate-binding protein [Hyphomonas sp.]